MDGASQERKAEGHRLMREGGGGERKRERGRATARMDRWKTDGEDARIK